MQRRASCCCGNSQIEVTDAPSFHCTCNCTNCKQRTGSAFGIGAYFCDKEFRIVKDGTQVYRVDSKFGKQQRHFCGTCGTTLFWFIEAFKNLVGVAGGCFTDDPLPQPSFNAVKENQCEWVSFSADMDKAPTLDDILK